MRPVRFCRVTQEFANPGSYASEEDQHGDEGHHTGIDWGMQLLPFPVPILGQRIRSVLPGEVVFSEYNSWAGNWVGVYTPSLDITYTYWHGLTGTRRAVAGEWVELGDVLMRVGSTGNSTAPHLHVQANPGRDFDYHAHVAPRLARGPWFGQDMTRKQIRAFDRRRRTERRAAR